MQGLIDLIKNKFNDSKNEITEQEECLERLRNIQSEIKELDKNLLLPKMKHYTTGSGGTFPCNDMEVYHYIYNVMRGKESPLYPHNTRGLFGGNSIRMWEVFSEYFKELADYSKNLEARTSRIEQLKNEERMIKNELGID